VTEGREGEGRGRRKRAENARGMIRALARGGSHVRTRTFGGTAVEEREEREERNAVGWDGGRERECVAGPCPDPRLARRSIGGINEPGGDYRTSHDAIIDSSINIGRVRSVGCLFISP